MAKFNSDFEGLVDFQNATVALQFSNANKGLQIYELGRS